MRWPIVLSLLVIAAPNLSAADALWVYSCEAGQVRAQQWMANSSTKIDRVQLLRTGSAHDINGRIDSPTSHAMFESRGIWSYISVADLFSKIPTLTPPHVLSAIALTESGRKGRPWPWTINHQGRGMFFSSKEKAVNAALALIKRGQTRFDVGLMQVNWYYNGERFNSIESAFDPLTNIRVADKIIQEHLQRTNSMYEAVGRYHSKTPRLKHAYVSRVSQQAKSLSHQSIKNPSPNLSC